MRRECPSCDQEFSTDPVTATGESDGDRVHLIACSWACLEDEIHQSSLCQED